MYGHAYCNNNILGTIHVSVSVVCGVPVHKLGFYREISVGVGNGKLHNTGRGRFPWGTYEKRGEAKA